MKDKCKKISYGLQIMRRMKYFIPQDSLILLANSLVLSHLDYCSPLLHNLNSIQLDTLLKLQKCCDLLVFSCNCLTSSKPLFIKLNWLPLHQRIEHNTCVLMFKINNNITPIYLTEMFKKMSDAHSYNTRSSKSGLYTDRGKGNYYTMTFRYFGTKLWNALLVHLHTCSTLENFKKQCAHFFMDNVKSDKFISYGWTV